MSGKSWTFKLKNNNKWSFNYDIKRTSSMATSSTFILMLCFVWLPICYLLRCFSNNDSSGNNNNSAVAPQHTWSFMKRKLNKKFVKTISNVWGKRNLFKICFLATCQPFGPEERTSLQLKERNLCEAKLESRFVASSESSISDSERNREGQFWTTW